jgi:hypothetical protein
MTVVEQIVLYVNCYIKPNSIKCCPLTKKKLSNISYSEGKNGRNFQMYDLLFFFFYMLFFFSNETYKCRRYLLNF